MGDNSWWFASQHREFLGEGVAERYDGPLTREATARARSALCADDVLVGWLPFEPGADGVLIRPQRLSPSASIERSVPRTAVAKEAREVSGADEYKRAVVAATDLIRAGELDKVVLARSVEVSADGLGVLAAMQEARKRNPEVFAFVYDTSSPFSATNTLFGVSPELLVRRSGPVVTSVPLAGSVPRGPNPVADQANALALLRSHKDRAEHRFVVQQIVASLQPLCAHVIEPGQPRLVATDSMWHLATTIQGVLADAETNVIDVAVALHPTPAICGTPTARAAEVIAQSERESRGLYAGAVGWCDGRGDGEWAVTLRSGQISGEICRIHSGAGIVADSDPESEWAETAAKLATMQRALGLSGSLVLNHLSLPLTNESKE